MKVLRTPESGCFCSHTYKFTLNVSVLGWPKKDTSKIFYKNITIEFCIFDLVMVPNFSLNYQLWIFGQNLPKKSISGRKRKKMNITTELYSLGKSFSLNWQFWFFGPDLPEKDISGLNQKNCTFACIQCYLLY